MQNNQVVVVTGAAGCLGHHVLRLLCSKDDDCAEIRCLDLQLPTSLQQNYLETEIKKLSSQKQIQMQTIYPRINDTDTNQRPEIYSNKPTNAPFKQHQRKQSLTTTLVPTVLSKEPSTINKTVKWFQGDVRDINLVESCLQGADCIIHCAARIETSVYYADQNEDELEAVNVGGTENLLRAAIRLGVPKFIHVSSYEAWLGYEMIYYATESTLPVPRYLLYGPSGETKLAAANKVRQYSNNMLQKPARNGDQTLNAVIIELPQIYGEFDTHYVTWILKIAKFFNNQLPRISNIWTRQHPIYAGNAAWSTIVAKNRMYSDQSISGEEFIITDDTKIDDPYKFMKPFLESKGMSISQVRSYPFLVIWFLMVAFFFVYKLFRAVDVFGLTDQNLSANLVQHNNEKQKDDEKNCGQLDSKSHRKLSWYHYINPQIISIMCITNFFNRAKATLRLDYEPLFSPDESIKRSLAWYEKHCII